ncbi:MAG: hypothetical protein DMG13_13715 [Acidobacteria bacterium]|nr:MAG: hypothetical protein DMG13_13715 [Acidobacteriota bacterium]
MLMRLRWMLLIGAVVMMAAPNHVTAQIPYESSTGQIPYAGQYNRGQDVVPSYDGWRANADGSFSMYFGYMNRNYEEELDIDIGPGNNVDGGDRGQPTHFYPRRHWFVFKVVVPKDWGVDKKVVWTLSIRGKTNTAKGWLQRDWEINNEVMMENVGAGNRDPENEAPVITGTGPQTITLPNTVALSAVARDDLLPKPRGQRNSGEANIETQGLSVQWIQYRGAGPITFSPPARAATSTPATRSVTSTTIASFKVPGVYVVRAVAGDTALESFHDITVTVK